MKTNFSSRFIAIASLLGGIMFLSTCHKPLNPSTDYMVYDKHEGLVGNAGGKITITDPSSLLNGASIEIPQGALDSENKISLTIDNYSRPLGDSLSEVIKLEPDGLIFNKPVTLKIPVDNSVQNYILFYFNPDSDAISQVPIIDYNRGDGLISTKINNFSRYFVKDKGSVFFDATLFQIGNTIKATIKFSGKDGLASISTNVVQQLSGYNNVKQLIDYAKPTLGGPVIGNIRIDLLEEDGSLKKD